MNINSRSEAACSVAIIGGGFAGSTLAAQLLRRSGGSVSVILIEQSARLGRGVAYGTQCGEHLLNVRAKNMSAYPDEPEHFLRWARSNHDPSVTPDDYLPRQAYGQYVAWLLQQEIDRHPGRFAHAQEEAVSITRNGDTVEICLGSGETVVANKVVLALGNFPPGDPRLPGKTSHSQRYVPNPWVPTEAGEGGEDKSILLVGSGLTSVDIAIALRARGFGGAIHILSRRGLLPQSHQAAAPWPPFWNENSPRSIRGLLRLIRVQAKAAERQGSGWRAVIDSLRPFTQEIWRSLPRSEQRRFLRHVRPYWEVHRHRIANQIDDRLSSQRQSGQIEIHAGRITQYEEGTEGVDVTYSARESGELKRLRVDRVINCTGPEADCRRIENLLLTDLLRQKMVRPDPLFLGLDTSDDGALINDINETSDILYTLGPARKGSLWETTAVPEIRAQSAQLAAHLLAVYEAMPSADLTTAPKKPQHSTTNSLAAQSGIEVVAMAQPVSNSREVAMTAAVKESKMYFEQFYLGCLSHASYMLASGGEAVVVDPQRDVEIYLKAAQEHGVTIRHIFETHLHADFVSGHKELAARTGARIYMGPVGEAPRTHTQVNDGFELRVGAMRLRVLETPGHTPESICLVVTDEEKSPDPWAVLTGDTLFIGDVGRPDLSSTHSAMQLAGMLYHSLHTQLLRLPDEVLVYPAHGAGSLCGRNMRAERSSTIGTERLTNYALQITNKRDFMLELTTNLPARPEYFPRDAQINLAGAPALSELPELKPLTAQELALLQGHLATGDIATDDGATGGGVVVLDVRTGAEFAAGHVPGSINIALSGEFASWAGTVLGLSVRPVLIAASPEDLSEARVRLARIGMDEVHGYLEGGIEAWMKSGLEVATLPQVAVGNLYDRIQARELQVLDVRRKKEWDAGHIERALWQPLDGLKTSLAELNRTLPIAVHCKSGYRSVIACSLLQRAGFKNVVNITGGFDAWKEAQLPVISTDMVVA